jgi:hypothetical protein
MMSKTKVWGRLVALIGVMARPHRHAARVAACAVAIAGLVGVGLAGASPANAATPQCGRTCVALFSGVSATLSQPSPVLDAQGEAVGSPVVLLGASDTNTGEDFLIDNQGQVSDFYAAGLVSASVDLQYGGGAAGFPDDQAFEIEYAPDGVESGLCPGTASTAAQGTEVSLEPCGVSSTTVWIVDSSASINGSLVPLINGSDTNFSTPYVLTYPMSPSLPLETATLQSSAGQTPDNQLWSEVFGVLTPVAANTTTTVASSANPSIPGQAVTYTATVSPTDEGGSVAFADGGTPINGCTGQSLSSSGQATCQVTYTATGSHTITAAYSGDSAYVGSTSTALTQQVLPAAPGTPGAPTATGGNAQATVTVAAPSTGGTPSSYTVTATDATTGANGGQTCTVTGVTGSCTLTGLTNGDSYTFTSTATNPGGTSPASPASNTVTPAAPATAPGAPTIGTATAGPASATVTFTPPASTGGSGITSYTVTATDHTKAARGGQTATGTASPITVGGLTNGDSYTFTVTATNTVGTGPASAASNAATPEATKPSADLKIALSTPVKTKTGTYTDTVTITDNGPSTATTIISGLTVTNGLTVTAAPGGRISDRGAAVAYSTASIADGKSVTFTVTLSAGNKANGIQTITAATASLTVADPNYKNNVTTTTP